MHRILSYLGIIAFGLVLGCSNPTDPQRPSPDDNSGGRDEGPPQTAFMDEGIRATLG